MLWKAIVVTSCLAFAPIGCASNKAPVENPEEVVEETTEETTEEQEEETEEANETEEMANDDTEANPCGETDKKKETEK